MKKILFTLNSLFCLITSGQQRFILKTEYADNPNGFSITSQSLDTKIDMSHFAMLYNDIINSLIWQKDSTLRSESFIATANKGNLQILSGVNHCIFLVNVKKNEMLIFWSKRSKSNTIDISAGRVYLPNKPYEILWENEKILANDGIPVTILYPPYGTLRFRKSNVFDSSFKK